MCTEKPIFSSVDEKLKYNDLKHINRYYNLWFQEVFGERDNPFIYSSFSLLFVQYVQNRSSAIFMMQLYMTVCNVSRWSF